MAADPTPCFAKSNLPEQRFKPGDRVRFRRGFQVFKVLAVDFCRKTGGYLVHAKFGPCHLFAWQEDCDNG